jgi:hypothetical protein
MNVALEYLYRDASNYKRWGEVIFTTTSGLDIAELEVQVQRALIDGQYFVAQDWGFSSLCFSGGDIATHHWWHEYAGLSWTDKAPTQMESIEQFALRVNSDFGRAADSNA